MTTLKILFGLIVSMVALFLSVQVLRLYRRYKRAADNSTAKNIYIIKYNTPDDTGEIDEDIVSAVEPPRNPSPGQGKGAERRRHPRQEFYGFVDFIKEGTLYKERARDLSYSGIFIQSNAPEKYKNNDFIVMTFQTVQDGPQKRNGKIVRIDRTGIGVNFVP